MIEDDVIREVRKVREEYARLHGFNIRAMVADLQAQDAAGDWTVVSRPARRPHGSAKVLTSFPSTVDAEPAVQGSPTIATPPRS